VRDEDPAGVASASRRERIHAPAVSALRGPTLSATLPGMASRTPDRTRAAAALAAFGLLAAGAATAVGLVAVGTRTGQLWDDAGRGGASPWDQPEVFRGANSLLDTISVTSLAVVGGLIVLLGLLRGRPRLAVAAGVVLLGANVTSQVLKRAFDRPDLVLGWSAEPGAFPSGHTTVAMSLAMALMIVVPPSLRWPAALAGCAYAAAVGIAVIAVDWHRPSEVVGAYLVVVAWTALTMAVATMLGEGDERPPGRVARGVTLGASGAALAFALAVLAVAARRLDLQQMVIDRTAFAAAATLCAGLCAVLGTLTTALVQHAASPSRRAASAVMVPRDARRHPDGRG
jgi:membrane-associated phospholipid phosphatase